MRGTEAVLLLVLGLPLALGVALAVSYNRFVHQRQLVRNAWSNVDVELRRRYDLIPGVVETVKGYAAHERAVLEAVTEARSRAVASHGSPDSQARDENHLVEALRGLLALAEAYPALKASEHFLELQRELANTEDRIQAARRFYNSGVRDLNRRVESVPSNLVASMFGFHREAYFQVEPAVREPRPVDLGPGGGPVWEAPRD